MQLPGGQVPGAFAFLVDPSNNARAAWWVGDGDRYLLLQASAPFEQYEIVATIAADGLTPDGLLVAQGAAGGLGWAVPGQEGATLLQRDATGAVVQRDLAWQPQALAFAPSGELYWGGYAAGRVLLGAEAEAEPVELGTFEESSALALCVGPAGRASVAVSGVAEGQAGLYVLEAGAPAVRLADVQAEPRIVCGSDGIVHVAWQQADVLSYASSADWSLVTTLSTATNTAWALTVDEWGRAYLAWTEGSQVRLASARDWQTITRQFEVGWAPETLALTMAPTGGVQLLWLARAEAGGQALYYLGETPALQQLALLPANGEGALQAGARWLTASNLPWAAFTRVRFYVMARTGPMANAWQFIAEDENGDDGFAVQVPADLTPGATYALIAQAELNTGGTLVAQSDWLVAESGPPVILMAPAMTPWRGSAVVRILPLSDREADETYELWLEPLDDPSVSDAGAAAQAVYLGAYTLPADAAAGAWFDWSVDSQVASDGHYALYATQTVAGQRTLVRAADHVRIDNACPPTISTVTTEVVGRARDRLRVQVDASDDNGTVARVDLYLMPCDPIAGKSNPIWLGSDANDSGGWSIEVALQAAWRGAQWVVRAVAYDDDDYPSQWAESDALTIPPAGLQPRFLRPEEGRALYDGQAVSLIFDQGIEQVERVSFYLQAADGALDEVGEGQAVAQTLTAVLGSLPQDGPYRLLARVWTATGEFMWPGPEVEVGNARPQVELEGPCDDLAPGEVHHQVQVRNWAAGQIVSAAFSLRDAYAAAALLGLDDRAEDGLGVIWDTRSFLPGAYTLACVLTADDGRQFYYEWPLRIANPYAVSGLQDVPVRLTGEVQLTWELPHLPADTPVSLAFSPDDGVHWLPVAQASAAAGALPLDAALLPDSRTARLRLSWELNGVVGEIRSESLIVEQQNDPPQLALLSPRSRQSLPAQTLITWQAADPEDDELRISIAARQNDGAWVALAEDLPNLGRYELATDDLPVGDGWELRLTATDEHGASCEADATALAVTHNHPPTVRLIWPNAEADLNGETAILWSAFDFDGETVLVDLYYSDNAGQVWYSLAEGLPNTGYYLWETAFAPPGTAYRIRAVARDSLFMTWAQGDGLSTVGTATLAEVQLSTSQAGDALRRTTLVCWHTPDAAGRASLLAIAARETRTGATEPIVARGLLTGCAPWDTLYVPDGRYELVVTGQDAEGAVLFSRSALTVRVANQSLIAPQAEWLQQASAGWYGVSVALPWRAWDRDGAAVTAIAEASRDDGLTWEPIGEMSASAGTVLWNPLSSESPTLLRLRVQDAHANVTLLSPQTVNPAPVMAAVPDLTVSLVRTATGRVVRWLAQDGQERDIRTSLIGLAGDENGSVLAEEQPEVGEWELADTLGDERLTAVCVLADNGLVVRAVCSPVADVTEWSIERLSPVDGQELSGVVSLHWQVAAPDEPSLLASQRLWQSQDGGQTWALLAELSADAREYDWDTSALPSGAYWLRLEALGQGQVLGQDWGPWHVTGGAQAIMAISLATPSQGQTFSDVVPLCWRSNDLTELGSVSLSYRTAPRGPWRALARGLAPSGCLAWNASSLPNGSTIWLKVERTLADGRVLAAPERTVRIASSQTPRVTLTVAAATTGGRADRDVCWQAFATRQNASVKLLFSANGGIDWTTLAEGMPLAGCQMLAGKELRGAWPLLRAVVNDGAQQGIDSVALMTAEP